MKTDLNLTDGNERLGSTEGDHGRIGRDGEGLFEELEGFGFLTSTFEDLKADERRVDQIGREDERRSKAWRAGPTCPTQQTRTALEGLISTARLKWCSA